MTCDSREFFRLFFRELERRAIPYVILHSYQELPDNISSDIDYAVPTSDLPKLRGIQSELARKHGWALAQTLQHGVFAYYAVLVNLENPQETLKLDACSNYARARRFLVSEKILLGNRVPYRGFYIPAPAAEFIYVLAKMFDAKNKSPAKYLPRLKDLWQQDPENAQKYFIQVFGDTGRNLKEWFERSPEDWRDLRNIMLARNKFGPALIFKEGVRVIKRTFQPTGVSLAVLGSDGSGKSTLLANLETLLEPCFRYQETFHFRPAVFQKKKQGVITNPHGKPPRNLLISWLKVFYYFADHWAGWFLKVIPGKTRSTLIIFDRNFDDLLVDQKRYRLKGSSTLVRILRQLLPKADRVFILSASAQLIHQRKPELPIAELEAQQSRLQQLAANGTPYVLVSAEQTPEQVTKSVCREVVLYLATREEKRS
jgi:thymidylate kinase